MTSMYIKAPSTHVYGLSKEVFDYCAGAHQACHGGAAREDHLHVPPGKLASDGQYLFHTLPCRCAPSASPRSCTRRSPTSTTRRCRPTTKAHQRCVMQGLSRAAEPRRCPPSGLCACGGPTPSTTAAIACLCWMRSACAKRTCCARPSRLQCDTSLDFLGSVSRGASCRGPDDAGNTLLRPAAAELSLSGPPTYESLRHRVQTQAKPTHQHSVSCSLRRERRPRAHFGTRTTGADH